MKFFICRFAQQWEDFRLPELESVAQIQKVKLEINPTDYSNEVIQ
jgi:tRNA G10  N-methylase Trm11